MTSHKAPTVSVWVVVTVLVAIVLAVAVAIGASTAGSDSDEHLGYASADKAVAANSRAQHTPLDVCYWSDWHKVHPRLSHKAWLRFYLSDCLDD